MSHLFKWSMMPTGRWATTMNSHGGHIALHAWPEGTWAVTRGQVNPKAGDPFLIGTRQGKPQGRDLEHAMELCEAAALEVVERERIQRI